MAGPAGSTEERILAAYRETIDALYRYVSSNSCGDRALAEDVTQETWLRAVREWRRHGPPDRPLAWLITVARNLLASYYRRRRPASLESVSPAEVLAAADSGRAAESAEVSAVVCHALARLPAAQARLLEAFHFEDRRTSQLADAFGRMELTVQLERVQRELEMARARVEEVRRLVGIGTASPLDFKRAEVDLLEREAELNRLRTELEKLAVARE